MRHRRRRAIGACLAPASRRTPPIRSWRPGSRRSPSPGRVPTTGLMRMALGVKTATARGWGRRARSRGTKRSTRGLPRPASGAGSPGAPVPCASARGAPWQVHRLGQSRARTKARMRSRSVSGAMGIQLHPRPRQAQASRGGRGALPGSTLAFRRSSLPLLAEHILRVFDRAGRCGSGRPTTKKSAKSSLRFGPRRTTLSRQRGPDSVST